jgi:EAL domain-containing protein (putative c-di-GMP-specific phosphodiesterase class I)
LILHFQPQIDLKTSQLIGVEALVRWQHPKVGLIYPDNFIPLAEELNLIDDLTNEVINLAIHQEAEWKRFGYNIVVSINISAKNVTSLSLPEKLQEMIDTLDIDPSKIKIEITETELMNELTKSLDVLTRMRLKGFDLSIDDFGTGYSSLAQIKRNPFTELKIDSSFVMNATKDDDSLVIVESCIQLGHKLGLKVVAEGIEDKEILELLTDLGCDIGQGYYICKPICGDELLYWLHERLKRTHSSCLHSLSRNL